MKIKTIFPLLISAVVILAACDPSSSSTSSSTSSSSSSQGTSSRIATFALPQQITESYKLAINNREDSTKINTDFKFQEDRFFITENSSYKVGTDNPFRFMPAIDAYTESLDIIPLTSYHSVSHVDILETSGFRELVANEIESFVTVDNVNSTFDFTEGAIGHKFKLRVLPDSSYYTFPNTIKELSFEVEVIEGYNVHTVAELSMLDNHNPLWTEYKVAHGLSMDQKPKGIILHNDIKITKDDIPSGFLYTANDVVEARMKDLSLYRAPEVPEEADHSQDYLRIIGSLKDFVSIYVHDTSPEETFIFEGNYFSLDGSAIPVVRKFRDKAVNDAQSSEGSHSQLFAFPGDGRGELTDVGEGSGGEALDVVVPADPQTEQGNVIMRNISAIGNGGRENSGLSNGGLIFTKSAAKNITWENIIARNMAVAFFSRSSIEGNSPVSSYINYCKAYDSYSTMVYYWGSANNYANNSILKRSGGSLFISDEIFTEGEDAENDYPNRSFANLTTVNCELDASVTGGEPWFESHGASSEISSLIAMGALFAEYQTAGVPTNGKNIVKDGKLNIIALLIRGGKVFDNNITELKSVISINDAASPLNCNNLMTNTQYGPIIGNFGGPQFLTFESANGGRGYFNGVNNFMIPDGYNQISFPEALLSGNPIFTKNVVDFFSGDTINLYLKPAPGSKNIGVVLGY